MEIMRTEEEQVEAIKRWWKENGKAVITGLVLGIAIIAGYRYWTNARMNSAAAASEIYAVMLQAEQNQNMDEVLKLAQQLQQTYSSTSYAVLAAFHVASHRVATADFTAAETTLRWALDNAGNDEMAALARFRLARVLTELKKYDEALSMVQDRQPAGYESLYNEVLGDIQLAKGNMQAASDAYNKALTGLNPGDMRQNNLRMKIDNIAVSKSGTDK